MRKLKNLMENKAALRLLKTKLSSVINGTRQLIKATTIECKTFKQKINFVLNLISQNPSSGKISSFILTINVVTVTCTTSEKDSLSPLGSSLTAAELAISDDETSVQTTLTGSVQKATLFKF